MFENDFLSKIISRRIIDLYKLHTMNTYYTVSYYEFVINVPA